MCLAVNGHRARGKRFERTCCAVGRMIQEAKSNKTIGSLEWLHNKQYFKFGRAECLRHIEVMDLAGGLDSRATM